MTPNAVRLPLCCPPVRYSWYHFSCFHHVLGYAMSARTPRAMEYVAQREAAGRLVRAPDYPFVRHEAPDPLDPRLDWRFADETGGEETRAAVSDGCAVLALRDLYDVASFRKHFGQLHHPNWYIIDGYDRQRRVFQVRAEKGTRCDDLDARTHEVFEITDREAAFNGRRMCARFPPQPRTPLWPALWPTAAPTDAILSEDEFALRATLADDGALAREWSDALVAGGAPVNVAGLEREEVLLRAWVRSLRAVQVLAALEVRWGALGEPAAAAVAEADALLAATLFALVQARSGPPALARVDRRRRFFAGALERLMGARGAMARAADSCPGR
jgi:hypothetical protein